MFYITDGERRHIFNMPYKFSWRDCITCAKTFQKEAIFQLLKQIVAKGLPLIASESEPFNGEYSENTSLTFHVTHFYCHISPS